MSRTTTVSGSPIAPRRRVGRTGRRKRRTNVHRPRLEYRDQLQPRPARYVTSRSRLGHHRDVRLGVLRIRRRMARQQSRRSPLNSWVWKGPFTMNVVNTGVHTLGITRRESLAQVDKIFVGTSASATPTGTGRLESSRGGSSNTPPTAQLTSARRGREFHRPRQHRDHGHAPATATATSPRSPSTPTATCSAPTPPHPMRSPGTTCPPAATPSPRAAPMTMAPPPPRAPSTSPSPHPTRRPPRSSPARRTARASPPPPASR